MLAHVEPSWELCWGHVWAIYVETILRCQFFRPGPPPGAQNHVKPKVFYHRQDEIPCRRKARNTAKNNSFSTPQAKNINYRFFSWGGVDGVGRRLPPKAPARTPGSVAGARI